MQEVHLNAAIRRENTVYLETLPSSLTHLAVDDLPSHLEVSGLPSILENVKDSLIYLRIALRRATLRFHLIQLDVSFFSYPCLRHLHVNVELFLIHRFEQLAPPSFVRLDLDILSTDYDSAEHSAMLATVVEWIFAGIMPNLRKLGIARGLHWMQREEDAAQVAEIDEFLKALAREDGASAQIPEVDAGVVVFG